MMKSIYKLRLSIVAAGCLAFAGIAAAGPGHNGATAEQRAEHRAEHLKRRAEFQQRRADMIARFDTNKNGTLDDSERTAMHDAKAKERFAKMDTNRDGVLTLAEFKAGRKQFGRDHHARKRFHGRDKK